MPITVKNSQFRLDSRSTSYIFSLYLDKYPCHHYWGKTLPKDADLSYLAANRVAYRPSFTTPIPNTATFLAELQLEFSVLGNGDHRTPVFHAAYADGSTVSDFVYESHRIIKGKPRLRGLPATYAEKDSEAETLELILKDTLTGLRVILAYTVFEEYDAIARSIRYENTGQDDIEILSPGSMGMDFSGQDFRILHLHGDWMRERQIEYIPVAHGIFNADSKRGHSSHMQNPFVALLRGKNAAEQPDDYATENSGEVYGFSLVYSGNFSAVVEGSPQGGTRVVMGINPFNFSWNLKKGESFQTPEVVIVYSDKGLGGMSLRYHKLYRERLARGKHRDAPRPMVINNWEATGMEFTEQKIIDIAKAGSGLGIEMFVLDDGWFGKRDKDDSSLGDWFTYKEKLPGGLGNLIKTVNGFGMKFGLWFEPEMVSPDSDLYRAHPDWCLHAEGRHRTTGRDQLVLNLSKAEARDYLFDSITAILKSGNIEYVKWDCNRNITETSSRDQQHRHMLGVYDLMERLVSTFPDILFESCSGGGGRFDPGILYYMPQNWTSDNTDPIDRLRIQYGTSLVYPPSAMTAHVGKIKVGETGMNRFMHTCALAAMGFNFGFELDLSKLSEDERTQAIGYVKTYQSIREVVQYGDFYRLENPFSAATASWMTVSPDKSRAAAFFFQTRKRRNDEERRIRLKGLEPSRLYKCSEGAVPPNQKEVWGSNNGSQRPAYYGAELMEVGIRIPEDGYEYAARMLILE
ncbi:alpha-galactosidase [Leadbettera azotonutricia]|uniref:Alpha-galactosidase n=1 Tax=Leadbettera azotonutricia (strain ATCC BAA-888 / DSM 13862 / ZAS-9) TaxID=545695 RepID=F5Y819_LEAAZ|nr:alpha-galactosidase [Leadbettera azotonutricia]AEF80096.1 alpha-galactosidase AgaN [Leadbettera azotonutricia ZAS-9]